MRKVEFVHIEKTAGTSIRYAVEKAVGPDNVFIYSPKADRLSRSSDNLMPATTPLLDSIRQAFSHPVIGPLLAHLYPIISKIYKRRIRERYVRLDIPEEAKVVFGHFGADKFDDLLGEEPIRAVVLRCPLERMISHYEHWKRNRGYEDWRIHIPFRHDMTFEEFAMLPEMQNYQTQALAGKHLPSFAIVGTTECTEEFTEAFLKRLALEGLTLPGQERNFQQKRLNATTHRRKITIETLDKQFLQRFSEFHTKDYALYEQARRIQEQRMNTVIV